MDEKDDIYYVNLVQAGNVSSFSKLVEKHRQHVFSLAMGIVRNQQDAQEISQDAFVKAFKALNQFKEKSSFSTWLYRISYNTAISHIKKKRLETHSLEDKHENMSFTKTNDAYHQLMRDDRKKYLTKALDKLTAEERSIVHLYYYEEKDMHEIGNIMQLTHVNVRVKLTRTRGKLLSHLNQLLTTKAREVL